MARDLPTARVRRWVPPAPGMVPILISGWPKTAFSEAYMMSHIMASSQPPPSCGRRESRRSRVRERRARGPLRTGATAHRNAAHLFKSRRTYGKAVDGGHNGLGEARHAVPVREKVARVHLDKAAVLHLLDVGAGCGATRGAAPL